MFVIFFFFKQKTAYEMRISDWSSDVLFRSEEARDGGGGVLDGIARDRLAGQAAGHARVVAQELEQVNGGEAGDHQQHQQGHDGSEGVPESAKHSVFR